MNNQKASKVSFYIGLSEFIIAIIVLIIGVSFVGDAFENSYSGGAQTISIIILLFSIWESLLFGVSGFMIMKGKGSWGLSLAGNSILFFGGLFFSSKIWLFIICSIIGSIIGMLGLAVGLGTSLNNK